MSLRETYAAWKVQVENWRWAGVPFYLRAGKRMPKRVTEIAIQFRTPPSPSSGRRDAAAGAEHPHPADPARRGDRLKFGAKQPGTSMKIDTVTMNFKYSEFFGRSQRRRTNGF